LVVEGDLEDPLLVGGLSVGDEEPDRGRALPEPADEGEPLTEDVPGSGGPSLQMIMWIRNLAAAL